MIVSKLYGGLGNQMFQYAQGYVFTKRHNTIHKLDISSLENPNIYTKRQYALRIFAIDNSFVHPSRLMNVINRLFHLNINPFLFKTIKEERTTFNSNIYNTTGNIYLDGYWQSYRYFSNYEIDIRNIFKFRTPLSSQTMQLAREIRNNHSISIHVRRGDYVVDKSTNTFHGTCPPNYYRRAIEHFVQQVQDPTFYIFSDDIDWVKKNISTKQNVVYVTHNQANNSWQDMYLMSKCKHNIIANSSFSWWGAWLNTNPNKIVIAPNTWFQDSSISTKDLIPKTWIRL